MPRIVAVTMNEDGNLTFLNTDSADTFLECGSVVTRRASHVEPADLPRRLAFKILRSLTSDKSRIAAWTRNWNCLWRVNTSPVGGPILEGRWRDRQAAIDAEVEFLNEWFLERGQQ
jgi:hypothetical protein